MKTEITPLQERDACLALVLLILLIWLFVRNDYIIYAAMAALLLGMVWSRSMRPFAVFWFGLSTVLGGIMSRILLGLVWLCLVVPVGLARRAMGKDSMRLKEWRKNSDSVFVERNHKYTASDLEHPY